jgi:predicted transcriptional regulator of viral defense system
MPSSAMNAIRKKIWAKHRGWVFSAKEFASLGPRTAVDQALFRLQRSGEIRRIARGVYEYPKVHPRIGVLSPSPESVAMAVAAKTNSRVMISGATAANLLGLSTQVPSQNLFLTDGRSRSLRIGNQLVVLKHVAPSKMIGAGTEAGVVIQAVRFLGHNGIEEIPVETLSKKIPVSVKTEIKRLAPGAPAWLQPTLARLAAAQD